MRWPVVLVAFACARSATRPPRPRRPPPPPPAPIAAPAPIVEEPLEAPAPTTPAATTTAPTPALPRRALIPGGPAPTIVQTTPVLELVDRRADYRLRHANIATLAVSADAAFAASGSLDGTVAIWNLATAARVTTIVTPHRSLWAVAIAPGGTRVATAGLDGTTRLWDAGTGKELWSKAKEADRLAFTRDGTRLVGARYDVEWIWKAYDAQLLVEGRFGFEERSGSNRNPCYTDRRGKVVTPDGRSLVTVIPYGCRRVRHGDVIDMHADGYTALITSLDHPATRRTVGNFSGELSVVAFSPGSDRFAATHGRKLFVADMTTGKQLGSVEIEPHLPPQTRFAFAPDGHRLVMWNLDDIVVWTVTAGVEQWRDRFVNQPGATPAREVFAAADVWLVTDGGTCTARDLVTGRVRWQRERCHVAAAAGKRVVLARGASALDVVDTKTGVSVFPARADGNPGAPITSLAVARDGRVAAATQDGAAWLWDDRGARELVNRPGALQREVSWRADGTLVAIAETRTGVAAQLYGRAGVVVDVPHERAIGAHVLAGDRLVIEEVFDGDHRRTVVDLAGGASVLPAWRPRAGLDMRDESLHGAALTHDLARAYIRGTDGEIHLWNLPTGRLAARARASSPELVDLVLSPDHQHLLVTYRGGIVELRDAQTLAVTRTFAGATTASIAAFSPDGSYVVAASREFLYAWRLADGAAVATVAFAREAPSALAFAPDARTLWVGTTLGGLYRFEIKP